MVLNKAKAEMIWLYIDAYTYLKKTETKSTFCRFLCRFNIKIIFAYTEFPVKDGYEY